MRGTNIFAAIGQRLFESNVGRIRWRSNMWALVGGAWDRKRIQNSAMIGHSSVNEFGEFVKDGHVLVKKPNTSCPQAPGDEFYFDGKWWWVPAVACKKCQYHRSSTRGMRFPRCTFQKKSVAGAAVETLVQVEGMMAKAMHQTEELVKGRV